MLRIAGTLLAALAWSGVAPAAELRPLQAQTIALGAVRGVAYYTETPQGYEIVATMAAGESGTPMRFIATLMSGQKIVLSVPQAMDNPAIDIEIARHGNSLVVSDSALIAKLN
jgi:hypothetical protein